MDYKYYEGKIGYLKNIEKLESLIQDIKLDEELSTGEKLDLEKRINKEIEKLKDAEIELYKAFYSFYKSKSYYKIMVKTINLQ